MFPPGLEPGTFRVLGERDNRYPTETVEYRSKVVDYNKLIMTLLILFFEINNFNYIQDNSQI